MTLDELRQDLDELASRIEGRLAKLEKYLDRVAEDGRRERQQLGYDITDAKSAADNAQTAADNAARGY